MHCITILLQFHSTPLVFSVWAGKSANIISAIINCGGDVNQGDEVCSGIRLCVHVCMLV